MGDYLYKKRTEIENHKKILLEKSCNELEEKQKSIYNEKSFKIFESKKITRLKEIFNLFDSDNDGVISPLQIDISNVPGPILEIFTPLLQELEELNQDLNFEEFLEASDKLLKTLSVTEKSNIFGLTRKNSQTSNKSFSFQVDFIIKLWQF